MSTWTHVAGVIRVDDYSVVLGKESSSLQDTFIRNTWYHPNENGNMPMGSEGSLDVEIIKRPEEEGMEYMKTVTIFGDLRDFGKDDIDIIKNWWKDLAKKLAPSCSIRQAVLEINPEDSNVSFILTDKDMDSIEELLN